MNLDTGKGRDAFEMFMTMVEGRDHTERMRLVFAYRLAHDPRLDMFYDEKSGTIADIVLDRLRALSLTDLEALDTDSFWCGILGDCLDRESLSEPWTPEQWAAKQIEFEEIRNQILTKAGERE